MEYDTLGIIEGFKRKYGYRYTLKIDLLQRLITQVETGENRFTVIGFEPGLGKSISTNQIIIEYLLQNQGRRFLVVKKFKEDVIESTIEINSSVGDEVAVGVTSENWSRFKDDLQAIVTAKVVIITHQRYADLNLNCNIRNWFTSGRHTLIIDESIPAPICSFSERKFREIREVLPISLQSTLLDNCQALFNEIASQGQDKRTNFVSQCYPRNLATLEDFRSTVEASKSSIAPSEWYEVLKFLDSLFALYNNECLINKKTISCLDSRIKLWTHKNNLILDANAHIDWRYRCAPNIEVLESEAIKDYSSALIYHVPVNTSRDSISDIANFKEEMTRLIKNEQTPDSKTLIVSHNKYEKSLVKYLKGNGFNELGEGDNYNGEKIAVSHFGALVGKNHWRDFNQVFIVANPLYSMQDYILNWEFYSQTTLADQSLQMYPNKSKGGSYSFIQEEFENVRLSMVASEIYQAIERINRNGTRRVKIFVVTSDLGVMEILKGQFPNIIQGESPEVNIAYTESSGKQHSGPSKGEQLFSIISRLRSDQEVDQQEYPKKYIRESLGWDDDGNLAKCLKFHKIIELEVAGIIEKTHKTIIIRRMEMSIVA